jgi:hypothetical protein
MAGNGEETVLVLKDMAGNFYLLTRDTLERARVSADLKPHLEEQLGDVGGFALGFQIVGTLPAGAVPELTTRAAS